MARDWDTRPADGMVTRADELSDDFKGTIHLGVFGVATAMLLWNLGRWLATHQWTHAANALTYLGLMGFEARQIRTHWSA